MSFGGGGGGDTSSTVRYAPYVEQHHSTFLGYQKWAVDEVLEVSPFAGYEDIEVEDAFFGAGYTIASFPSLYDMYGKFMAGLDIEALYQQLYEDTVNSPVTNNLIAAEGALLDDEININSLPRFQAGMRDINSVMSSTFIVGKALIEDSRTKSISKFSASLKQALIPIAQDRWGRHLEWNKNIVMNYAEIMKLYYMAKSDVDDQNYGMREKNSLWYFTVMDYWRSALGALQGATTTKSSQKTSKLAGILSGAAAGAMAGNMILPGWGAGIGGIVGGLGGLLG
ncbi:MAG: protein of unknown function DUF3482 [Podoviridae sp. cty5g4]|nr:MAG: protein of unknown function DUF3482 [Podoviridae sp. cty5g4]